VAVFAVSLSEPLRSRAPPFAAEIWLNEYDDGSATEAEVARSVVDGARVVVGVTLPFGAVVGGVIV